MSVCCVFVSHIHQHAYSNAQHTLAHLNRQCVFVCVCVCVCACACDKHAYSNTQHTHTQHTHTLNHTPHTLNHTPHTHTLKTAHTYTTQTTHIHTHTHGSGMKAYLWCAFFIPPSKESVQQSSATQLSHEHTHTPTHTHTHPHTHTHTPMNHIQRLKVSHCTGHLLCHVHQRHGL